LTGAGVPMWSTGWEAQAAVDNARAKTNINLRFIAIPLSFVDSFLFLTILYSFSCALSRGMMKVTTGGWRQTLIVDRVLDIGSTGRANVNWAGQCN
jgi:hypothetical protein